MTAVIPGNRKNQFNLALAGPPAIGLDVQDVRPRGCGREGHQPGHLDLPVGSLLLQARRPTATARPAPAAGGARETYDHSYRGWSTIEQATLRSDNTVYAQLTLDVTPEAVAKMARKLGVRSRLDVNGSYVPAIGLGAMEVSPLDMASAYATLAAGGIYSKPTAIRRVVLPDGEDTQAGWGSPSDEGDHGRGCLRGDADPRGEHPVRDGHRRRLWTAAAGKTGTTEEHSDAWFCGYTPRLTTAVWVGYPKAKIPMEDVHGIAVSGGSFPADIWRLFMSSAIGSSTRSSSRSRPTGRSGRRSSAARSGAPSVTSTTRRLERRRRPRRRDRDHAGRQRRAPPEKPKKRKGLTRLDARSAACTRRRSDSCCSSPAACVACAWGHGEPRSYRATPAAGGSAGAAGGGSSWRCWRPPSGSISARSSSCAVVHSRCGRCSCSRS